MQEKENLNGYGSAAPDCLGTSPSRQSKIPAKNQAIVTNPG